MGEEYNCFQECICTAILKSKAINVREGAAMTGAVTPMSPFKMCLEEGCRIQDRYALEIIIYTIPVSILGMPNKLAEG